MFDRALGQKARRGGKFGSGDEGERSFSPPPSRGFLSRRIRRGNFFTQELGSDQRSVWIFHEIFDEETLACVTRRFPSIIVILNCKYWFTC